MVKVAVVSGGNKGIGYAIVRALCKRFTGDVYLTSRDETLGKNALDRLKDEGLAAHYHQLDITDASSVDRLCSFLRNKYGGVDCLVNNAAIAYKGASTAPFAEQAQVTVNTNYTATLRMCTTFLPLMNESGRIVNVSSRAGRASLVKDESIMRQLASDSLTIEQLSGIMAQFVTAAQDDADKMSAFGKSAYGMSKVGVTVLTAVLQRHVDSSESLRGKDVLLNSCCPGYIDTDMTSHKGSGTIDQGADTPTYLALLPAKASGNPRGAFLAERKLIDWATFMPTFS